ncbi:MAG: AAA family ATPase, partial [Anaerolineae bacterium]|nr:hypothetical protein [Thermoflexales bacterium]MDW8406142.1 AAA family ATPase [Anaerolineae bacterium]
SFYLHEQAGRYYFSTTPNLNRALAVRMDNLTPEQLAQAEWEALRQQVGGQKMKTFIWPGSSADIPDDEAPKLLIFREADPQQMQEFMRNKGQTPRVHRNTLFFLAPLPTDRARFDQLLRRHLAIAELKQQKTLVLTPEQRQTLERDAKQTERDLQEQLGHLYRQLYLPGANGLSDLDLGIPTHGVDQKLDVRAYERLRNEGRLVERLAPLVIKERYLANRDYVETQQLAESGSRAPGEMLAVSRQVWENAIAEGVRQGLFGLGELDEQGQPRCLYFNESPTVGLAGREVIIRAQVCKAQRVAQEHAAESGGVGIGYGGRQETNRAERTEDMPDESYSPVIGGSSKSAYANLRMSFDLPLGKVSSLLGLLNLLQKRFNALHITIEAKDGAMGEDELEDKVRETFRQMQIDPDISY